MKKLTRFLLLVLSVVMLFSAWGCGGTTGSGNDKDLTYTDSYLVKNGRTDYVIVYEPRGRSYYMDFAITDFQDILRKATNVTINAIPDTDESVVWSEDAKYISIGHTKLLEAAGITVDYDRLLEGGRVVKTVGNSLFIAGGVFSWPKAVYDIMYDLFDYEWFANDEIALTPTEEDVRLPLYDYEKIPSINVSSPTFGEYASETGDLGSSRENTIRSYNNPLFDSVFPNERMRGGGTWHNILGHLRPSKEDTKCLPKIKADLAVLSQADFIAKYSQTIYNNLTDDDASTTVTLQDLHPSWYSNQQLAFSAKESREELLDYTFEAWQGLVTNVLSPEGLDYAVTYGGEWCFSFTPMDTGTWSTTEESLESLERYGENSAEYVLFMNEVLTTRFNPWFTETFPGERMKVLFFAYQAGTNAPILKDAEGKPVLDENGNYIPVAEEVKLAENCTLMYAPIRQSFYHAFIEEENKGFMDILKGWQALFTETSELTFWLYAANFEDASVPLDRGQGWYANYKWAAENKCTLLLYEVTVPSIAGDWTRLWAYLAGKYAEDIENSNPEELIKHWFKNYFKDASDVMYKFFEEYRAWFAWLAENTELDWLYLTEQQQADRNNWPYALLKQWIDYIYEAEDIISRYKTEDPALYKKLHTRIMLESVTVRYLMLRNYNGRLDDKNAFALELMNDALAAGWDKFSASIPVADHIKKYID